MFMNQFRKYIQRLLNRFVEVKLQKIYPLSQLVYFPFEPGRAQM